MRVLGRKLFLASLLMLSHILTNESSQQSLLLCASKVTWKNLASFDWQNSMRRLSRTASGYSSAHLQKKIFIFIYLLIVIAIPGYPYHDSAQREKARLERTEKEKLQKEIATFDSQLKSLQSTLSEAESKAKLYEGQVSTLSSTLETKEHEIDRLKKENSELSSIRLELLKAQDALQSEKEKVPLLSLT